MKNLAKLTLVVYFFAYGVLAIYCGNSIDHPDSWFFFFTAAMSFFIGILIALKKN